MKIKMEGLLNLPSGVGEDLDTDEIEHLLTETIMDEYGIDESDITFSVKVEN